LRIPQRGFAACHFPSSLRSSEFRRCPRNSHRSTATPATRNQLPRLRRFPHASCRPPYARLLNALIKDGRTLLLVSHAGRLLGEVCQRCIYLEGGQVKYDGATSEAVRRYEEASVAPVAA
jgi:hypothetical protein